jgi:dolichyl-phosphate-mannose-protein mannosyltransferase
MWAARSEEPLPTFNKTAAWRVLVIVFLVAVALRLGYGLAGYRHVLSASGATFIALWDHDPLEHVLIAKGIMEGKGYVVDSNVDLTGKHPRLVDGPAIFKAPLYQYLLAGIFSVSGFSFALFFPLQALLGGGISVLVAKLALEALDNSPQVGLYAGLAAAIHPVLVNTASQPYNETVFFFLFFLSLLMFFRWMGAPSWWRAIVFGVVAGLTTLTRESMVAPFVAMVALGVLNRWRKQGFRTIGGAVAMIGAAVLTVAPWTLHNYQQYRVFLPVSSISGTSLSLGNNECIAGEGLFVPFDGDGGCLPLDAKRYAALKQMPAQPFSFWNDRAYAQLGREFVLQHPVDYLRLCVRRAWTTFLPYHPRQNVGAGKKLVLVGYFVLVIAMGLVSIFVGTPKGLSPYAKVLLWVAVASYAPLVAVYVSADLRYRVGIDLILGCFAGFGYALISNRGYRAFIGHRNGRWKSGPAALNG